MGKKRHFTQKQKLDILESAKDVGIKKAADLGAVHYSTVYQWQRPREMTTCIILLSQSKAGRL